MRTQGRTKLSFSAALLAMLFLVACSTHATIADITRAPGRFAGKEVTIQGKATLGFSAMGNGIYQVDDGTGQMWVLSQTFGIPGDGETVSVTGNVEEGFRFGGRSFGVILRQTRERR